VVALAQQSQLEDRVASYFDLDDVRPAARWLEEVMCIPYGEIRGLVNFDITPWCREPIDSLNDPEVQVEASIFGSQLAKTTMAIGAALATVCLANQSAVWMWPTEKVARSFSQTKFQQVVEHSPSLRVLKHSNHDLFKNLEMHFVNGVLSLIGSHASVDQKQRSVPVVIVDEIEDIAAATEKETDPITSIKERTKTFTDKKIFLFGSCLLETGPAWQQYLLGDQRHFLVPCPHCQTRQALEFRGAVWMINRETGELEQRGSGGDFRLWWDPASQIDETNWDFDAVRASACYICVDCGGKIHDRHKRAMLQAGRWVPTCRAKVYGQRSRRISALYPTWPNTSFANVAIEFLGSRGSAKKLQNFTNNWEAKPWTTGLDINDKKAVDKRLDYILGQHVRGTRVGARTIMVVDVQRHHLVWALLGFDAGGSVHLIDCGYTQDFVSLRKIDDELLPDWVAIDTRHRAQEVYEAVHERRGRWMALRGEEDKPKTAPLAPNYVFDPFTGDKAGRQGMSVIALIHLNSDLWGEEFLNRLYPAKVDAGGLPGALPVAAAQQGTTFEEKQKKAQAAELAANAPRIRDFFVFMDMAKSAPDFVRQLFSEFIEEYSDPKNKEKTKRKWKRSKNNHLFDLMKYGYAIGSLLGYTRIGAEIRKQLEAAAAKAAAEKSKTAELALSTPSGGTPLF
jgi:phage terminase large subunit GpA-like protein